MDSRCDEKVPLIHHPVEKTKSYGNKMKKFIDSIFIKDLLPAKLGYFSYFGSLGCLVPYYNVFLISIGLSASESGLITGLRTIPSFILGPLFGAIADKWRKHKIVLLSLVVVSAFTLLPLPWIAKGLKPKLDTRRSIANASQISLQNKTWLNEESKSEGSNTSLFFAMLLVISFSSAFQMPIHGILDSTVMKTLERYKDETTFGGQRVFGSAGSAIAAFVAGVTVDNVKITGLSDYAPVFLILIPFATLSIVAFIFLKQNYAVENQDNSSKHELKDVIPVLNSWKVILFFVIVLFFGVCFRIVLAFVNVFLQDIGSSKTLIGLTTAVSSVSSVIGFAISPSIIKSLRGPYPGLFAASFAYGIRFMLTSFCTNPFLALPVQCLHAITFSLSWTAIIEHTHTICPQHLSATVFTIVNALFFSVGNLLGSILGGYIYEHFGGKSFFQSIGTISFILSGVILIYCIHLQREEKRRNMDIEAVDVKIDNYGAIKKKHSNKEVTVTYFLTIKD